MLKDRLVLLALACALIASPLSANSLISPGPRNAIAKSSFSAVPNSAWNRLSTRAGPNVETWTLDGPQLNNVTFYGGIAVGKPLIKEQDKRSRPLPRVTGGMLLTDIADLLENTYRAERQVARMSVDRQEAVQFSEHQAVRFTYSFAYAEDEVERKGEAYGTLSGGKVFLITYEAPALHFFDKDLARFRDLVQTMRL
jgi:hypothetical protein